MVARKDSEYNFLFFKILFIYLWPCWVFIAMCRFFLVMINGGYSLVVVHGLLIAVASLLVAEQGL